MKSLTAADLAAAALVIGAPIFSLASVAGRSHDANAAGELPIAGTACRMPAEEHVVFVSGKSGDVSDKDTAELGEKPAGVAAVQVRRTVKIITVDPYKKTISFMGPENRLREVSVDTPDLKRYLDELKDGDTVEVVYTEALAIAVTPQ